MRRAAISSLRTPRLPEFIDWLELSELRVGDASVDLLLKRYDRNVGVEVLRKSFAARGSCHRLTVPTVAS